MIDKVFTYGILMREGHRAAWLDGYRLDFGRFATVVESAQSCVYGSLIENVTPEQLQYYDQVEGYRPDNLDSSYYTRQLVPVTTMDGIELAAWVYVMQASWLADSHTRCTTPDPSLYLRMAREYGRLGHSEDALDALIKTKR